MDKIIAIVGPTASGKTDLAKALIKKFKGEVISVDSRQVYKGLDIGTAKDKILKQHLIDIKEPQEDFSVVEFQKLALKTIKDIQNRGKFPFLVGGTGYYLDSILYDINFPQVKPNLRLRQKLEKENTEYLYQKLLKIDPKSAQRTAKNRRRIIRALEIVLKTKESIPKIRNPKPRFNFLILEVEIPRKELYRRIDERVDKRIEQGMIKEVKDLIHSGVSQEWLKNLGLEYRYIVDFLDHKYTQEEMLLRLKFASHAFARRQLTWLKRYRKIKWIKTQKQAEAAVNFFLTK
ncbi:tRNA (adenosine(37)-N6)-dimethylallyltransferase MiaA [Candidatus Berkelbacteria bacterium]|nr:tRNA (adenosine(37)-N6)-dimethylallyltransferase MiaA [Candidatus Berkelbacteria bacterium]